MSGRRGAQPERRSGEHRSFSFLDGERLIRLGAGAIGEAPGLLSERGFDGYVLLATERSRGVAPAVVEGADEVLDVPTGPVPDLAASLLGPAGERPVVGLGGGRVVDVAKAVSAVHGTEAAAIPTTLAGSTFTAIHRLPDGAQAPLHRPSLAICEPEAMVPEDAPLLAATAMNALAHATEALYGPRANPVAEEAALRAVRLFAENLSRDPAPAPELAEAGFLAGYAVGSAGLAVHHALSQTIVRTLRTPHAKTNAVMLPHSVRLMSLRAPGEIGRLTEALGDPSGDPEAAAGRVSKLAARSGHTRLSTLGVEEDRLPEVVAGVLQHPGLAVTPDPPGEEELLGLLRGAL